MPYKAIFPALSPSGEPSCGLSLKNFILSPFKLVDHAEKNRSSYLSPIILAVTEIAVLPELPAYEV